ncbi:phenol degradation protein meta [Pseudomonas poae]|uniref:Phenol degradation protein meta n=1 Tax=Pseudomonas poae TaxID=200451 RepID=A0A423FAR3_9PSED|nr:transporter [Pseudomonas poae]ROM53417.1 phenol degradation protein meta [Pseudomonas poae]
MSKKHFAVLASATLFSGVFGLQSEATENGVTNYPVGVNTVLNGLLPAPGETYFYNYFQFYRAEHFNNSERNSSIPKFHVELVVDAPRIVHTWNQRLGPFTLASGAIMPIFHTEVAAWGMKQTKNDIGDMIVHPLLFGYSNDAHNFFTFLAPFDMALPTGAYDKNRIANPGQNHLAFMPNVMSTWFPTPKVEVSTAFTAELYTKNHDTNYKSGTVLSVEGMVGYSLNEKWQVGVQGFFSKQVTDDKLDGDTYLNGFRGQVAAFGPQVRYNITPAIAVVAKYQHEFAVENRSEGDKFWVQFAFPL